MPSPETPAQAAGEPAPVFALVGHLDSPASLLHACEELREAGYRRFDAHTPFPVHGLERAMGLRASPLPWVVLGAGALGLIGSLALQAWTMGVDYPQNISGKPFFAWEAYVPVTFEATVLLAALGTFLGMWGLNGLPRLFHPVMQHSRFERASDDRFFVSVEASDPSFDRERTRELLGKLGVQDVEEVAP